jgi:hypothetical protein
MNNEENKELDFLKCYVSSRDRFRLEIDSVKISDLHGQSHITFNFDLVDEKNEYGFFLRCQLIAPLRGGGFTAGNMDIDIVHCKTMETKPFYLVDSDNMLFHSVPCQVLEDVQRLYSHLTRNWGRLKNGYYIKIKDGKVIQYPDKRYRDFIDKQISGNWEDE